MSTKFYNLNLNTSTEKTTYKNITLQHFFKECQQYS